MQTASPSTEVLLRRKGPIAIVTLSRPAKLNTMTAALITIVADLNADCSIRAAILTSAGDRAFCAGRGLRYENDMVYHLCFHIRNAQRGIEAFKNRQTPEFQGN